MKVRSYYTDPTFFDVTDALMYFRIVHLYESKVKWNDAHMHTELGTGLTKAITTDPNSHNQIDGSYVITRSYNPWTAQTSPRFAHNLHEISKTY